MTTAALDKKTTEQANKNSRDIIEKPNDTLQIISMLLNYMAGGEKRAKFTLAVIVRIIALLGLISLPFLTGQAINVLQNPGGTIAELQGWVIYALIAGGVFLVMTLFAEQMFADLATQGLQGLQTHLFSHMQTLSLNFFDRQPIGELLSRITNDTEVVSLFYEQAVGPIIRASITIILAFLIMVAIDWRLTIVALLIVPAILILTNVIERISTPAFAKLQEDLGTLSGFQEESLSGHKVIISKRQQDWADEKNDALATNLYEVGSKAFFTSLLQYPLTQSLASIQIVLVLIVGAFMVVSGEMLLGTVIAFAGYSALLTRPLSEIANLTSTTLNAVAGGRRVFSVIVEQPTVKDLPDANEYEFKGGRIECTDVDFSYVPGRKILRQNTFNVEPGEAIGICGPTGAGKSTLINILTRYYDIDSGTILIDGQDLSSLTQESLRKQIGVVLQEAFLFSDTVMNNLKYAREGATDEECIAAAKEANAHSFIMNLPQGYDTMLTERGANLSQGQRQMITIARAMVAQPKIMILDEATSNVDTRTEKLIQDGLRKLMGGKTSFSIAHRLATIRDSAKIMVLNGGEIVEYASHDELMADKGFYYALYMSQFKGKAPAGTEASNVDFVST
ncbi:MAG: ABC transporter ATP-binding protein [Anaerolineales bacterium]|jgi:ATP-binding cassette subfamily B protein